MSLLIRSHLTVTGAVVIASCLLPSLRQLAVEPSHVLQESLRYSLLTSCLLCATVSDLSRRIIPNQLSYSTLAAALGLALAAQLACDLTPDRPHSLMDATVHALACGAILFLGWSQGAIGGGDVKLVMAIAALLGSAHAIFAFLAAHFLAAFYLMCRTAVQRIGAYSMPPGQKMGLTATADPSLSRRIPMAGFYSVGMLWILASEALQKY